MQIWAIQTLNSLALGGLLFMLSSGFALIFGLMRIANLSHGAYFMFGAYIGLAVLDRGHGFGVAVIAAGLAVGIMGGIVERVVLRRLAGNTLSQVLATLGVAFVIADGALWIWGGDPRPVSPPEFLAGGVQLFGLTFPLYRLAVLVFSILVAIGLWALLDKTRLGVMIRASVDDRQMAQGIGVPATKLFTVVFCLGTALAGLGGVIAAPILSVYPGLDADMLPLALVVVILGGSGSLLGSFVGSLVVGFIYNFGQALLPELAYFVLFLPMLLVLLLRPQGLFGRHVP